MPKRSEIEAQMAALQEQLAAAEDDDDYEVWIKNDKGHETRVPSKKAGGWLKDNFGITLADLPDAAGSEEETDEGEKDPKPAGGGYFGKRKS